MRKLNFFIVASVACCLAFGFSSPNEQIAGAVGDQYYVGGMTAGFLLNAGGVEIVELSDVTTAKGCVRPSEIAGLKQGDCIRAVEGVTMNSIQELNLALNRSQGKQIKLTVKRGEQEIEIFVTPVREKKSGNYKIGILIRDTLSGVGTVTYIHKNSKKFAALGHNVCDENHQPLQISESAVYSCSIIGVNKGVRGRAGELRGLFINEKPIAKAEFVCQTGLYGVFSDEYDYSKCQTVEIAPLAQATIGKAIIYSTVDGTTPKQYEINIVKVDEHHKENKNFVVKVTDERLIEETGGIVQGMSGSPIIQNGKLIGAVTHVFLNDPTRGYGIGIENMIKI